MFGKKDRTDARVGNEATEEALIAKAMQRVSGSPRAYEAIKKALRGRNANDLSERELMRIIDRAIAAAQ